MKKKGNKIGWCDITVNPVTGCPNGCEYCYARGMNDRWKWVDDFSKPQFFPNRLKDFRTKEPMIIFIDSMSDIGTWNHSWIVDTLSTAIVNSHNTYLALTKKYNSLPRLRHEVREAMLFEPIHVFIGATVTNNAQARAVIEAGGADFISFEPLLERIEPELLAKLQCKWWIVGDLTKNGKPQGVTQLEWYDEMFGYAGKYLIPFFMKESLRSDEHCIMIQEFPAGWKP